VENDGSYSEEGFKNVKGNIWGKEGNLWEKVGFKMKRPHCFLIGGYLITVDVWISSKPDESP